MRDFFYKEEFIKECELLTDIPKDVIVTIVNELQTKEKPDHATLYTTYGNWYSQLLDLLAMFQAGAVAALKKCNPKVKRKFGRASESSMLDGV